MVASGMVEQALNLGAIGLACILGVLAASLVVVVLHELAHTLVGFLLGFRILAIQFGGGMPLRVFSCFGVRITLHRAPWAGLVQWQPRGKRLLRTRFLAAVLAGPLANIAVAVAAFPYLGAALSGDVQGPDSMTWFVATFGLVTVAWALAGLVPVSRQGTPKSDMAVALSTLAGSSEDVANWLTAWQAQALLHDLYDAVQRADFARARVCIAEGDVHWPASGEWSKGHALVTLLTDDPIAALAAHDQGVLASRAEIDTFEQGCTLPQHKRQARNMRALVEETVVVNGAFFLAHTGRQEDLVAAEQRCATRNKQTIGGDDHGARLRTHGMILLRLGRVDEGMQKLQQAFRLVEPFWLRALCAAYLAYGHALRGDARMASRFLRKARRLGPRSPLVDIAERWTEAALAPQSSGGGPGA
jgi:hypothetical protein